MRQKFVSPLPGGVVGRVEQVGSCPVRVQEVYQQSKCRRRD